MAGSCDGAPKSHLNQPIGIFMIERRLVLTEIFDTTSEGQANLYHIIFRSIAIPQCFHLLQMIVLCCALPSGQLKLSYGYE